MVRLLSLSLYQLHNSKVHRLGLYSDVSSVNFFFRGMVSKTFAFLSRTVTEETLSILYHQKPHRQTIKSQDSPYVVHVNVQEGIVIVVVTDIDYPDDIGMMVTTKLHSELKYKKSSTQTEFEWERAKIQGLTEDKYCDVDNQVLTRWLKERLELYTDPMKVDRLRETQSLVEEVKGVVIKNIEAMKDRNEALDKLIEKSIDLDNISKSFLKDARRTNRCPSWCQYY